jgi:hypothetical protein
VDHRRSDPQEMVAYLHAAGHFPGLKTEYHTLLSRHEQGARRCFRPPFTTSWPWWAAWGAASCGMLSGPAQPPCPRSGPAPPRPPGAHATARAPPHRWQVLRPARIAPRVPTTQLLPPPRLPGDPMRCPRPSDARVQAPPRGPAARQYGIHRCQSAKVFFHEPLYFRHPYTIRLRQGQGIR